ncbi:heavy metal-binding domain-containing protein [Cellulophaga tyrosinoxydans]|uniref:Heavy metal binding domain-containing protein n=1 Tax=Cellulophaga tyrosinoxydans TaxID=504486 RepID=A0A1W2BJ87_9FLAO|nr:heavy metal-binding domain-containing protein [Cellulophaga tyrosinoxydans]SMC72933.1 hypothetical protein SAMN05660703_2450 [Cellulophaga tyrosinoxydans]
MKIKTLFLPVLIIILVFTACKDKKNETKEEVKSELVAETRYQCPMNCEDGKTYDHAGTCPVCKMELALLENDSKEMSCTMDKDGKCSCDDINCKCPKCSEHAEKMECKMGEDGKCSNPNCEMHTEKMECTMHKDGKCKCEGEKCSCKNCKEHSKKMECTMGDDGKCSNPNCAKHATETHESH